VKTVLYEKLLRGDIIYFLLF